MFALDAITTGALARAPKFTDVKVTDEKIRVHGSTAVATARWSGKVGDVSDAVRFTVAWMASRHGDDLGLNKQLTGH